LAHSPISDQLCRFIGDAFLGDGSTVERDTPLLALNILDSASLFDVVDFVRQAFGVHIPAHDIHPQHFSNVASLEQLIQRLASWEIPA